MPNLTNITGFGTVYYSLKLLTSGGPAINISLPELKYIPEGGSLDFEGTIGRYAAFLTYFQCGSHILTQPQFIDTRHK